MEKTNICLKTTVAVFVAAVMLFQTCMAAQKSSNADKLASGVAVTARTSADTQPPFAPKGLTVTNKTYTSISLSWKESHDNTGVKGYQVFRDGQKIISTKKTSFTNTDLVPGRKYTYTVKAYDAAGNLSESSTAVSVTTLSDIQAPTAPGKLSASSATCTSIMLNWEPSTDNTGVKGYEIYCNGRKAASTTATCYSCKRLTPGQKYDFYVIAYDIGNNYSRQSNVISASTLSDTTAPSVPGGLKAASVTGTEVNLIWTPSSDNVKVKGYEVFCNGTSIGTTSNTSFSSKKLIPGSSYVYTVRAMDTSGNISGSSVPLKVSTLKDLQPPTAPTKLKVNSVKGSSVSLSWNASTDNLKVKGYKIYCNGMEIATTTRTSCTVKNLPGFIICVFWVKAYDISDNLSAGSNAVTVFKL